MKSSMRATVAAMAAAALAIGLAGCGSDGDQEPSTSAQDTTDVQTSEQAPPEMTLAEYIKQNGVTETPVGPGDPGTPVIELPPPPGWLDVGTRAPLGSYVAFQSGDPATVADPPTLIVYVFKLTGDVEAAKVLEYAPGEIQTLPGYEGPKVGTPTKFGGFDATQIGGSFERNGARRAVGQMTSVIPGQDGLFVVQVNADGAGQPKDVEALAVGSAFLAQNAKITQ